MGQNTLLMREVLGDCLVQEKARNATVTPQGSTPVKQKQESETKFKGQFTPEVFLKHFFFFSHLSDGHL